MNLSRYSFYESLKLSLKNVLNQPRFYTKKTRYPYTPKIKDLRIKTTTKVSDHDLTKENSEFLKKLLINFNPEDNNFSPLKETPWPRGEWFSGVRRTGVIAKKIGQFPQWTANGKKFFVTLLQIHDNHVINYNPPEKFSQSISCKPYWKGKLGCITIGTQSSDPRSFSASYIGLFEAAGLTNFPKAKISRFIIHPEAAIQPGTPITVNHYKVGHFVDCEAKTISHGFEGVVTRWGFKGGCKGRGNTKSHRRPGSFGGGKRGDRKSPGTVFKGTRMAGLMGGRTRVQRGLRIWRINTKHNVLYVHGYSIPGPINSWVKVFDTRIYQKSPKDKDNAPPFPTYYPEDEDNKDNQQSLKIENVAVSDLHDFLKPSIHYQKDVKS